MTCFCFLQSWKAKDDRSIRGVWEQVRLESASSLSSEWFWGGPTATVSAELPRMSRSAPWIVFFLRLSAFLPCLDHGWISRLGLRQHSVSFCIGTCGRKWCCSLHVMLRVLNQILLHERMHVQKGSIRHSWELSVYRHDVCSCQQQQWRVPRMLDLACQHGFKNLLGD